MASHRKAWAGFCCAAALALVLSNSRAQNPANPNPAAAVSKPDTAKQKPSAQAPIWLDSRSYDRSLAALARKVDVDFDQTPLTEVAEWAGKMADVSVRLDKKALADAGVDEAATVSLQLRGVSLRTALRLALRQQDLKIGFASDGMLITTADVVGNSLAVRVYPVADLTRVPNAVQQTFDNEVLIELITGCIAPPTWDAVGGPGSIKDDDGILVVNQTIEIHRQIEDILNSVRRLIERQRAGDYTPMIAGTEDPPQIKKALAAPIDLEVDQTPLVDLARQLSKQFAINILVDTKSMHDAGFDESTPLSGKFKQAPLRSVLTELLREHDLKFIIDDEVLHITTNDVAACALQTVLYPVRDLTLADEPEESEDKAERLTDMLTTTVSPTAWDVAGGSGSIKFWGTWHVVAISTPGELQTQIADLFVALRKLKTANDSAAAEADKSELTLKVYKLPAVEDAKLAKESAEGIAAIIRETIEPNSWQPGKEGRAYLQALPDRLVVRHHAAAHKQIFKLLKQLASPEDPEAVPGQGGGAGSGQGFSGSGPF